MDPVKSDNKDDEHSTNDFPINSGAENNAPNDNDSSNKSPDLLVIKSKEIPLTYVENGKESTDEKPLSPITSVLKLVSDHGRKSKTPVSFGLKPSSSSPELQNNLIPFPPYVGRKQEIKNAMPDKKVGSPSVESNQEVTDPSTSLMAPTDDDTNADRSPSGRRRIGIVSLPKLMMPNSVGVQESPLQAERTHETIVEDPMSACSHENASGPNVSESDTKKESTPETGELTKDSRQRKISVTKRFVTTPVSDVDSNPFLNEMTHSSNELSSSSQSFTGNMDFNRSRRFSASTPLAPKRVQKRSVDNSNLNFKPSTPQTLRKDTAYDEFESNSLNTTPNTTITTNKLLDQVRRKNFSTNTNPFPPSRKISTESMGSQLSLSRKFSEQGPRKGSSSPSWQKRLSQLFVPPSMEELNKRSEETSKMMPDDSGPPSAMQSRHGSRRGSKSADSVSKLFGRRRSKRKSVTKIANDGDEQDRLEMLDKLEDTEGLSDGDSGNNDDDDSSSDYTDDETRGMVGRRSESFPLVKGDKVQPSIMRKEGQGDASYDDTICSNRSSYFKHFYNLRPGKPQARSMQSRVNWHHTSIASLIREKQLPDELGGGKKKKPPIDYPQVALSFFLFLVICVMVSLIFYFYKLHIMSVFIFNRIKIVEKTRNLEVLNFNDDNSGITPVVIVRLGVNFPLNARHTDCTQYLKYLLDVRGDINKYKLARKRRSIDVFGNTTEIIGTDDLPSNLHPIIAKSERVINETGKIKRRKNGKSRLTSNEKKVNSPTNMPPIASDVIKPSGKIRPGPPFVGGKNKTRKRIGAKILNSTEKRGVAIEAKVPVMERVTLSSFSIEDTTEVSFDSRERLATAITEQPENIGSVEEKESANYNETSDEGISKQVETNSYSAKGKAKSDDLNSVMQPLYITESDVQIKADIHEKSSDGLLHTEAQRSSEISEIVPNTNDTLENNAFTSTNSTNTSGQRRFPEIRRTQTTHGLVDKIIHGDPHSMHGFIDPRSEGAVEGTVNPRFLLPKRRKTWKTPDVDPAQQVPEGNFDFVEPISVEDFDSFDAAISDQVGIEDEFSEMQCIDYKGNGRLQLTQRPPIGDVDCFSVHWESPSPNVQMKDCFIMDNNATGAWWGMGDITGGSLPLSKLGNLGDIPLYSGEIQRHLLGGLIRRVWISSKGILVSVPLASKTVFSVNAHKKNESEFCLGSEKSIDVNHPNKKHNSVLDYTICTGPNVKSILGSLREVERMNEVEYQTSKWHRAQHHIDLEIPPPEAPPEITESLVDEVQERFNCPVWRPWLSHDEGAIDQDDVVAYAEVIAASSFDACGHVLLPVTWQHILGDLDFDQRRFPNPKLMIESLMRKGLRVALSLSPLIDTETPRFKNSSVTDLLVRQVNSTLPILVSTNRATLAGVLDFTNPNTIEWYASELKKLQENYGIDRFHVSPINTQSLPPFRQQYTPHQNPDYALGQFIKAVSQIRPPISTDVAVIPVNTPTFLLAGYGDASWEMLEMLPNRILSISSVGGTLVDSGVIGGWSNQKGHIPSRELYIRWMTVSIFFPAMQLSVLPSMYDAMVVTHANYLQSIRKEFVIPRFNENLPETLRNDYPLVSPLAIAFPKDTKSLKIGDQWMVGKDMMVAPVLRRGRRARDIYLPPGIWKDGIDGRLLKGKRWLKNYVVPIGKGPFFFFMTPERGNKGTKRKNSKPKRPRYH